MSTTGFEIQSKSDFLTGSYLITRIPESEVDRYALNTIQADCPDFILPFSYKSIDGQVEFAYKVGTLSRLHYFAGEFTPKEYAEFWQSLLIPLIDCGDWFMHPCSFVLCSDYLYYDKSKKTVSYIYIPSINGCSGYDAFHEMAASVSKIMTVSDAVLENKVLRSIIKDFNPTEFIKMLKEHVIESVASPVLLPTQKQICEAVSYEPPQPIPDAGEEIIIDIEQGIRFEQSKKERVTGGYRIFGGRSKRCKQTQQEESEMDIKKVETRAEKAKHSKLKKEAELNAEQNEPDLIHQNQSLQIVSEQAEIIDITQNTTTIPVGPGLRYVGHAYLPPSIQVAIAEGEIFTIGRFDVSVGKQQSSFEFDKKTKAVSRRHAVIERDVDGYKIIDLASSAGTFIDDNKLPPNTPCGLETGCRVSFGNSGADYVWEVS